MKKLFIVLLALFTSSCYYHDVSLVGEDKIDIAGTQTSLNNLDTYLIFGHFYNMCDGESCVENFLVTESILVEDSKDAWGRDREFSFTIDRTDKLEQVNDILNKIPESLINETAEYIGCPDCSDGGGLLIELKRDGEVKRWLIDKQRKREDLVEFINLVDQKIQLLQ